MLLANIYLLCCEFDKWQALVPGFTPSQPTIEQKHLGFLPTILASGIAGILVVGILFTAVGFAENKNILYPILVATGSLLISGYLLAKYRTKYVLNS